MSHDRLIIYTDGAARGNPGPAAIGVVIKDETGGTVATLCRTIGTATNNQAEYRAVIAGMEKAISLGARQINLKSDSDLIVQQINGRYKVKNAGLRELYSKVVQLAGRLEKLTAAYIPREQNTQADALCNKALDGKQV